MSLTNFEYTQMKWRRRCGAHGPSDAALIVLEGKIVRRQTNGSPLALVHTLGLMGVRAALTFDCSLAMLRGNRDADLQEFVFQEARKE